MLPLPTTTHPGPAAQVHQGACAALHALNLAHAPDRWHHSFALILRSMKEANQNKMASWGVCWMRHVPISKPLLPLCQLLRVAATRRTQFRLGCRKSSRHWVGHCSSNVVKHQAVAHFDLFSYAPGVGIKVSPLPNGGRSLRSAGGSLLWMCTWTAYLPLALPCALPNVLNPPICCFPAPLALVYSSPLGMHMAQ